MPPDGLRRPRLRRRATTAMRVAALASLLAPLAWDEYRSRPLEAAAAAAARGDLPTALGLALTHLRGRPWSRDATLIVARSFSQLDHAGWAEPYYERIGLDRLDLADAQVRALALFRANRRDDAVAAYRAILDRRPDDILALRRLAAVRIAQGNADEGLTIAQRLIRIPAGAEIGHTLAGTIRHDLGDTEHAVAEFLTVLRINPALDRMPLNPRSTFWTYLGQDLLTLGRADEAQVHLERALGEGNNAVLAAMLASSYRQLGNLDAAERWWRAASGWNRRLVGPWLGLGRLALQRGHPELALEPLARAAELAPRDPAANYSLGLAHRQLGHLAEADRFGRLADQLRATSGPDPTGTMTTKPAPAGPSPPPATARKPEP